MKNLRCSLRADVRGLKSFVYDHENYSEDRNYSSAESSDAPKEALDPMKMYLDAAETGFKFARNAGKDVLEKITAAGERYKTAIDLYNAVYQAKPFWNQTVSDLFKEAGALPGKKIANADGKIFGSKEAFEYFIHRILKAGDTPDIETQEKIYGVLKDPVLLKYADEIFADANRFDNQESMRRHYVDLAVDFLNAVSKSGATKRSGELVDKVKVVTDGFNIGSNGGAIDKDDARDALSMFNTFNADNFNGFAQNIIDALPENYADTNYRNALWENLPTSLKSLKVFEKLKPEAELKNEEEEKRIALEVENIDKFERGFSSLAEYIKANVTDNQQVLNVIKQQPDHLKKAPQLSVKTTIVKDALVGVSEELAKLNLRDPLIVEALERIGGVHDESELADLVVGLNALETPQSTGAVSGLAEAAAEPVEGNKVKGRSKKNNNENNAKKPKQVEKKKTRVVVPEQTENNAVDTREARTNAFLNGETKSSQKIPSEERELVKTILNSGNFTSLPNNLAKVLYLQQYLVESAKNNKAIASAIAKTKGDFVDGVYGTAAHEAMKLSDLWKNSLSKEQSMNDLALNPEKLEFATPANKPTPKAEIDDLLSGLDAEVTDKTDVAASSAPSENSLGDVIAQFEKPNK